MKSHAMSLLREESPFPMLELAEAYAVVDHEIRSAMRIQLRKLSFQREPQLSASSSQEADPSEDMQELPTDHVGVRGPSSLERKAASLRHAGLEEQGKGPCSVRHLDVAFASHEDCLIETVAPPFLGRRVGAPEGVTAPFALPPFRASLVDGYALHIPPEGWREVAELYGTQSHGQQRLTAGHSPNQNRVAFKILGEVRAGASLSVDMVEPFRGHPHIRSGTRGDPGGGQERCGIKCRTVAGPGRATQAHEAVLPAALRCVYVTTGAPVPTWCNAVVPVESCEIDLINCLCWPDYQVLSKLEGSGENIREAGTDAPADSLLLQQGQLIGPAEEGLLAAVGLDKLSVFRKLNVHTLALGDELRGRGTGRIPESEDFASTAFPSICEKCFGRVVKRSRARCRKDSDGDFRTTNQEPTCSTREKETTGSATTAAVYDSNSPMLQALLHQHCASTRVGHQHVLPDNVDEVRQLLLALAFAGQCVPLCLGCKAQLRSLPAVGTEPGSHERCVDVLVSSGGVSMGGSDCMKHALLHLQNTSFERHGCGQCGVGSKARTRKKRSSPPDTELQAVPSPGSGHKTSVSEGWERTTQGGEFGAAEANVTTSATGASTCATHSWSYSVETEIKFGRLNVKPGKPTMFAVLRVFRHDAATAAAVESNDDHAQHDIWPGEMPDATGETGLDAALTPSGADQIAHNATDGKKSGRMHTPSQGQQISSPGGRPHEGFPSRIPIRVLLVFALPGNPCSAWVLFHLLVGPALNYYSSFCLSSSLSAHLPPQLPAILDEPLVADSVRPEYHRALLYIGHSKDKAGAWGNEGSPDAQDAHPSARCSTASDFAPLQLHAYPTGRQTSSRLLSCCASANGLILVAPRTVSKRTGTAAGETVCVGLCGTPFAARPDPLIRLLKLQNIHTRLQEARCRCGGPKVSSELGSGEVYVAENRERETASKSDPMFHKSGLVDQTPAYPAASARSFVAANAVVASHFSCHRPFGEAVKLGIVIVSDRCFHGQMQDACAEALLKTLRSSRAVATILQLGMEGEACDVQRSVDARRVAEGEMRKAEHMLHVAAKHATRISIVPDSIESIQDAVSHMLCACADTSRKMSHLSTDGCLPRRNLIFICGGTGLSTRDVTPQAVLPLFTVRCNGIEHMLLEHSLRCTPLAALGRPCAGVMECRGGRQTDEGDGAANSATGDVCHSAARDVSCTQSEDASCNLLEKSCWCALLHRPQTTQDCREFMTETCCCRLSYQSVSGRTVAPCQDGRHHNNNSRASQGIPAATHVAHECFDADSRKSSRLPAGCGARSLVMVFPGSPKAVAELAEALLPVLPHALEQFFQ